MDAVGDPSQQSHDWEPGIEPSGLFWTVPFPSGAMSAAPGSGGARLHAEQMAVPDFHDFFNAIAQTPDGFVGEFVAGDASITFTCQDDDSPVVYTSVPEGQSTVSAGVGHERNGVFFS